MDTAELLWVARPPPELRGGIGDALITGIENTYALGQVESPWAALV